MKLSKADFPLIRWNILAICASLLISALVLYSGGEYAKIAHQERRDAQNQLNDARKRLNTALEDQKNMEIYADGYGALIESKIIGDNHRLDWMESLEKIHQKNLTVDFRYNIAPQKTYAPQPAIDSGNFDIHYSEMKLQFDLLHEGQLLNFFTTLRTQIKGWYQLEGCTLKRENDTADTSVAVRLIADCNGGWITLKNRNAPQ